MQYIWISVIGQHPFNTARTRRFRVTFWEISSAHIIERRTQDGELISAQLKLGRYSIPTKNWYDAHVFHYQIWASFQLGYEEVEIPSFAWQKAPR